MRKRIVGQRHGIASQVDQRWMNLEDRATLEVTSEALDFPIESAFSLDSGAGWRAAEAGKQLIRLLFDHPVSIEHIELRFDEPTSERTQEFALRCASAQGGPAREIVRQQWNFSPAGSTTEREQAVLELEIKPDVAGRQAIATLTSLRLR
jgi:hypothetical protein